MAHVPVLLHEVLEGLSLEPGDTVVDGTLGEGGHAKRIAEMIGPTGLLVGIDTDERALARAKKTLAEVEAKIVLVEGNFRSLDKILTDLSIHKVQGVLLDLGVNSNQLDDDDRGFSFKADTSLVMTLTNRPEEALVTARDVVNDWSEESLADIIYGYGEERFSRRIARGIVERRTKKPIETTGELVSIIEATVPAWYRRGRLHPATRTFQAIRIAVNDELGALREGLMKAFNSLAEDGRLAIISFHSLEAHIVKDLFKQLHQEGKGELVTKKAIKPTREEEIQNPRSRSAQLRVIKKY